MLLKKEHVTKAMNLSTGDVVHALERNGYKDKISYIDFRGMTTNGSFVYECTYIDLNTGNQDSGNVYVHYNERGLLIADF
jgi:hypothetical protein